MLPADPLLLAQRIRTLLIDRSGVALAGAAGSGNPGSSSAGSGSTSRVAAGGGSAGGASVADPPGRAAEANRRLIIGIAGAPGAGKSTLAAAVAAELGPAATLVGMDGFHLAQRVLKTLGLAEIKGAPDTFDSAGYVALLRRLLEPGGETIYAPEFRRSIEEPIAGAVAVPASAQVIITEGNYLLLDTRPWNQLSSLMAEVWFLDTPQDVRLSRLVHRHVEFGRTPQSALDRAVSGSDGRNAALVLESRARANLILRP